MSRHTVTYTALAWFVVWLVCAHLFGCASDPDEAQVEQPAPPQPEPRPSPQRAAPIPPAPTDPLPEDQEWVIRICATVIDDRKLTSWCWLPAYKKVTQ